MDRSVDKNKKSGFNVWQVTLDSDFLFSICYRSRIVTREYS